MTGSSVGLPNKLTKAGKTRFCGGIENRIACQTSESEGTFQT